MVEISESELLFLRDVYRDAGNALTDEDRYMDEIDEALVIVNGLLYQIEKGRV